jgi:prepilin-type N-terminal cleavage/methylation domain-containing protein
MTHRARTARRAAFTLVELLVTMAILATLASLAISAVFTLRNSQMKSFTETTVQKLGSALDQQWKAVMDDIYGETPSAFAMQLANQDIRRGRVIHTKLRLAQEYPTSFAQVLNPSPIGPKPTYSQAIPQGTPAGTLRPDGKDWESAALLFLALSQSRRGMAAFKAEELVEPTAIQSVPLNGREYRIFVDSWGNPLRYYPFPTGNDELNQPPYLDTSINPTTGKPTVPLTARDPQDPEGTLYSPPNYWPNILRNQFQVWVHPLQPNVSSGSYSPTARYLMPVIASAGRDGNWGIDLTTMAVTNQTDADDNTYSYRLRRFGARGD